MNTPPPSPLRRRALLALLLTGPAMAAQAQTVWRCGPQRNVYSQRPCADGSPVEVDDTRDATQQREARRVADAQADEAQRLRQERLAREAEARARPAQAVAIGRTPVSAIPTPKKAAHDPVPPKAPKGPKKGKKKTSPALRPSAA